MNHSDLEIFNEDLTPKQRRAVTELLAQRTQRDAARAIGVAESTLITWMRQPSFRRALADTERLVLGDALRNLARASVNAVWVLEIIANDADAAPSARVSAARAILDAVLHVRGAMTVEERITFLEERIAGGGVQ